MNIKSITGRIAIGKSIGFLVGAFVFFFISHYGIDLSMEFRIGLWFFYIMLGAQIGLFGVLTRHTILKIQLPFWLRGTLIGVVMHLMLVLLAYDEMNMFMQLDFVKSMGFISPYWALIDGMILGIIIDGIATKYAGEGSLPQ